MKRFWDEVSVHEDDAGHGVRLDARDLSTPKRTPLRLPTRALADAIAEEWRAVDGPIDPGAMPMTGLANAAIDRIAGNEAAFADELARYAENELTCYRAERPEGLVARQCSVWDPLLDWAERTYDVAFVRTVGVVPVAQPAPTLSRMREALDDEDAFTLAGLSPLVRLGGSLVAALAVRHGAVTADAAWEAFEVDRLFQAEQWGADEEAERAAFARQQDFMAGARFLDLSKAD